MYCCQIIWLQKFYKWTVSLFNQRFVKNFDTVIGCKNLIQKRSLMNPAVKFMSHTGALFLPKYYV